VSGEHAPHDSVDGLLASWARAAPELDVTPVAVIARLGRLARMIDQELEITFAQHGLNGSDFAALVTLRRLAAGRPGGISQRRLMRELHLTSGTVSVRVERLVERGWATRSTDPVDRRNSLVALTDAGQAQFARVAPAHLATEHRLLAALDADQLRQLADLLRTLLLSFEGSAGDERFPRLGLMLAPAHVTLEMRRAVGLPDRVGLLVREVEQGGAAADAGVRQGDVLVRAGKRELRSITALYAAVSDARARGRLTISGIRGANEPVTANVVLRPTAGDDETAAKPPAADQTAHMI
jgi:DNA-binding MarR family transcriptional regulator